MPIKTWGYIRLSRVVVVVNFDRREGRKAPRLGRWLLGDSGRGHDIFSVLDNVNIICGILGTSNCYITRCVYVYI